MVQYSLTPSTTGDATLTVAANPVQVTPSPVPASVRLVRPDDGNVDPGDYLKLAVSGQPNRAVPDGRKLHARNLARPGRIYNAFEVPATFTKGTLLIAGTERIDGLTATVTTPKSIPITFAAG
jgi:hypothetical protein